MNKWWISKSARNRFKLSSTLNNEKSPVQFALAIIFYLTHPRP